MTRLLEDAIETLRNLPEDEQDAAAGAILAYLAATDEPEYSLRFEQGAGLAQR